MPKLVVTIAGQAPGEFPVSRDRTVIGSKAANEIPIDKANADAEHAVINRCGDLYVIEDLGSATGTFVHGRKVTRLLLSDEDLIAVGDCQIRFVEDDVRRGDAGPPAAKAPAAGKPVAGAAPAAKAAPRPAAGAPAGEVKCPHCAYVRQPKDAQVAKGRCPSCSRAYSSLPGTALMTAESKSGDCLEVYEEEVVIKRKMGLKVLLHSLKGDLLEGIKGDKIVPLDAIASIQFKSANALLAGHITLVLPESGEGFLLAGLDDYTVEFVKREEPQFLEIKKLLDAKIS